MYHADGYLLAMDKNYPKILTMAGVEDVSSIQKMYDAAAALAPEAPIPALASQEIIDVDVHADASVYVGRVYVPFDIIGVAARHAGWLGGRTGPYLIMPAEQLFATSFTEPVSMNIAFVSGPGAAAGRRRRHERRPDHGDHP